MKLINLGVIFFLLVFVSCFPSYAAKIRGTPFDSSFHIGLTMGPGTGINFGIDGFIRSGDFSFGGEIEQLVTNHENEVNINATRYGVVTRYKILEELSSGLHVGVATFITSKDVAYKDASSGDYLTIEGGAGRSSTYVGISLDFNFSGFIITPKIISNSISDGGIIYEFDLNVGKVF